MTNIPAGRRTARKFSSRVTETRYRPILKILNTVLTSFGMDWDIYLTKGPGDALRFAGDWVKSGAAVVGVCGGDGTVKEVVPALIGQPTLLALFPGGTGNALAVDLGLPTDLAQAARLMTLPRIS